MQEVLRKSWIIDNRNPFNALVTDASMCIWESFVVLPMANFSFALSILSVTMIRHFRHTTKMAVFIRYAIQNAEGWNIGLAKPSPPP